MAYRCSVCDKGVATGKTISHSHRKTNRRFLPNLQRVKIQKAGSISHAYVCTSCLRSNKIKKAA
jgi:large subunit ribosomal protein L28